MKILFSQLGTAFEFINTQLTKLVSVNHGKEMSYKIHIHDDQNRSISTYVFLTLKQAMDWVNERNLMYTTEKKIFLEHVNGDKNSLIELNIYTNNVYKERPPVYRSQTIH